MDIQKPYGGAFVGDTHHFALRVYIEDTDLGGVVYHSNYLCFLERARSDMLRCVGIDQRQAIETGRGVYAVAEAHLKYLQPARLDDELLIRTRLTELRGASCAIQQQILRQDQTLTEASIIVAFLGPGGRPRRHPTEWAQKFRAILTSGEPSSTGR
jgi:acyl-CoA thioester hydrolase